MVSALSSSFSTVLFIDTAEGFQRLDAFHLSLLRFSSHFTEPQFCGLDNTGASVFSQSAAGRRNTWLT